MKLALTTAAALFAATSASGAIVNPGFEDGDNFGSGGITTAADGEIWGPSGEDFNGVPGANGTAAFAFYSNNNGESVYQVLSDTVAADTLYTLDFWLNQGGQPDGAADMFIGAVDSGDMPVGPGLTNSQLSDLTGAGITILATANITPDGSWQAYSFSTTSAAPGSVVGQQLVIGLYNGNDTVLGPNDIWFDEFSLSSGPVPEPGSLALIGLGGLALLRRRR